MTDRPPGRGARDGPRLAGTGRHQMNNRTAAEQADVVSRLARSGDVRALLALSHERDAWMRRLAGAERDGYRRGYDDGFRDGGEELFARRRALPPVVVPDSVTRAEIERRRYHVCCGRCRRVGHRPGCTRCAARDRDTFGHPHPDDYEGRVA